MSFPNTILAPGPADRRNALHPVTDNLFQLRFSFDVSLRDQQALLFGQDSQRYQLTKSYPSRTIPLEVAFTFPEVMVETRSVRRRNIMRNYAGYINIGEAKCTFHNWIALPIGILFQNWMYAAANLRPINDDSVISTPDINRVFPKTYKINATLELKAAWQSDTTIRAWHLVGLYPKSVKTQDLRNDGTGDEALVDVSFCMDFFRELPLQSLESDVNDALLTPLTI